MRIGIIPADITKPCIVEEVEGKPSLEWLQEKVDGYIELVVTREVAGIQPAMGIWLNEEGKVMEPPLEVNRLATIVARLGTGIFQLDRIHGDVVVMAPGGEDGMDDRLAHWFGHMVEVREAIIRHEQEAIRAMTAALS